MDDLQALREVLDAIDLVALREHYTADEVPGCSVCGGPLGVASAGGGRATVWACQTVEMKDPGWLHHYSASKFTQYRAGDSRVIALIDAVEAGWGPAAAHRACIKRLREGWIARCIHGRWNWYDDADHFARRVRPMEPMTEAEQEVMSR